ncbi:MAG: cytochrome c biogenesis protein CcdA [Patescibacteria group bacterium]|nr:cytochrome c biogenesis protein CcdA [Actinomycetota bacterium]MCL5438907.1 cytochrome c biogenesis protein CcdA [Patescibacteria group bacterium]
MNPILVSFSFLAGLQAFFAPCSVALIPAYVGYCVKHETGGSNRIQQLLFGLKAGSLASLGLITAYIAFGIIVTIFGRLITPVFPWIELFTGGLLVFMGSSTLLGYEFAIKPPLCIQTKSNGGKRFYLFGVAYAFGALGCTLPIFLLVIFQSFAQEGIFGGIINFAVYALAMSSLMIVFSLISSLSKSAMRNFLAKYMVKIQKSAGVLILLAGIYLIYLALQVISI